jgi:hypothetical protein
MAAIPERAEPIINEDGLMTQQFWLFILQVSKNQPIVGTGTPEGFVEATQTQFYMDDSGTAGNILYIKRDNDISGDRKKGWILV